MKLKNKALLVHLSIKTWSPTKIDKKESRKLQQTNNTQRDAAKVHKKLMSSTNLKDITFIRGQARIEHYKLTLPWKDGDLRIILAAGTIAYQNAMNKFKAEYQAAVKKFLADYAQDMANAPALLGTLYNYADYPDPKKLARRFAFDYQIYSISDETDFRVDLAENEIKALQQNAEKIIRESTKAAVMDVWERIKTTAEHIEERLTGTDPKGKAKIFHDTMIENARELADILPRLNIAEDPALDKIAADMKARLTKHTTDTLKTDTAARTETAKAAADIRTQAEEEQKKIDTLDALGAYRA